MEQDIPNFDTLLRIAEQNPNQLEELRCQLAQRTINQAPERLRPRLRGLQFQIDSKRKLAKTPLAACIALSNMMHRSFVDLCDSVNNPMDAHESGQNNNEVGADVVPFPTT
jgi:Protein of unknown function (DUF3135)